MRIQDNKQTGFSLLELVITMGVIVAMGAAVIPEYQHFHSKLSAFRLGPRDRQPSAIGAAASRARQRNVHFPDERFWPAVWH